MLIFVSDLHLASGDFNVTMDVSRLFDVLSGLLEKGIQRGVEDATLVLLGDIFEILKARQWIEPPELRPWQEASDAHREKVTEIFTEVEKANRAFFDGLLAMADRFPFLRLVFVPGNHDRQLNEPVGRDARARLQELLPLQQPEGERYRGGEIFASRFEDREHAVLARHGHEWDAKNRLSPGHGAIGDVIVVELLLRLPGLVAEKLGVAPDSAELRFLEELDNVRPQTLRSMAEWLLAGTRSSTLPEVALRRALEASLGQLSKDLLNVIRTSPFELTEKWYLKMALQWLAWWLRRRGFLMSALSRPFEQDPQSLFRTYAFMDFVQRGCSEREIRYVLCGHTHIPELVPIATSQKASGAFYINTGTWRRVHRDARRVGTGRGIEFVSWCEEVVSCIYSPAEQAKGLPPYEIYRFSRAEAGYG